VLFLFEFDTFVAVHKKTQSTRNKEIKGFMLTKTTSHHFLQFRFFLEHSVVPDFLIPASRPLQSISPTTSLEVFMESLASLSSGY
jgi:hypothetical protein